MNTKIRHSTSLALALAFLGWLLAASPAHSASDTDVRIIKATDVLIEKEMITIKAEAVVTVRTISGDHDPDYKGPQFLGRPMHVATAKSDDATFVILKPKDAALARFWKDSLEAAAALKQGKKVGRIAFYRPEVVIRNNLVVSIQGPGFLLGGAVPDPAEG